MTQRIFTAGTTVPQAQGFRTLARALASLLCPWRGPRPLYPDELSEHWRRDLGLPERDDRDSGLGAWRRPERW